MGVKLPCILKLIIRKKQNIIHEIMVKIPIVNSIYKKLPVPCLFEALCSF